MDNLDLNNLINDEDTLSLDLIMAEIAADNSLDEEDFFSSFSKNPPFSEKKPTEIKEIPQENFFDQVSYKEKVQEESFPKETSYMNESPFADKKRYKEENPFAEKEYPAEENPFADKNLITDDESPVDENPSFEDEEDKNFQAFKEEFHSTASINEHLKETPKANPFSDIKLKLAKNEGFESSFNEEQTSSNYAKDNSYKVSNEEEKSSHGSGKKMLNSLTGVLSGAGKKVKSKKASDLEHQWHKEDKKQEKAAPKEKPEPKDFKEHQPSRNSYAKKRKKPVPEIPPRKIASFYAHQGTALWYRCLMSSFLCLVLTWLSLKLPAFGALGNSTPVRSLVCLIFLLVIMLICLDVITNGLLNLVRGKPNCESLIFISAIISILDGFYIFKTGATDLGLPYCGVAGISLVCALWGSYFSCGAYALSFNAAAKAKDPQVVVSMESLDDEGAILTRSSRSLTNFAKATESADIFERVYSLAAPILILASFILSLFVFSLSTVCNDLLHILSASTAVCASFTGIIGFSLPFYREASKLSKKGIALAGYEGVLAIGNSQKIAVRDEDIFATKDLSIENISFEGRKSDQTVLSYASSLIIVANLNFSPVFYQLIEEKRCYLQNVDELSFHETGGIIGSINGANILVGNISFMRVMNIKINYPKSKTSLYVVIDGELEAVITMGYKASASAQRLFAAMHKNHIKPYFAFRDFLVNPFLLKQSLRLKDDNFVFPNFTNRCIISDDKNHLDSLPVGVYSRKGIGGLLALNASGKRLYGSCLLLLVFSLFSSFAGLLLVLSFFFVGAFKAMSCAMMIAFMAALSIPFLLLCLVRKS